jgi:hypothetical protein
VAAVVTGDPGPIGCLMTEFGDWTVTPNADGLGVWGATWRSEDGRTIRYLAAESAGKLLTLLRERAAPGQRTP